MKHKIRGVGTNKIVDASKHKSWRPWSSIWGQIMEQVERSPVKYDLHA